MLPKAVALDKKELNGDRFGTHYSGSFVAVTRARVIEYSTKTIIKDLVSRHLFNLLITL